MSGTSLILYPEDREKINEVLKGFLREAEVKCVLLVGRDGLEIAKQGFTQNLDTAALAALAAGAYASTRELARLVGEPEFSVMFHQGKRDHIHVSTVTDRAILVALFDDRTAVGLVRLCAEEAARKVGQVFAESGERAATQGAGLEFLREATGDMFAEDTGEEQGEQRQQK